MEVGVKRAGFGCAAPAADPSDREAYRAHCLVARTMEVFGGWEHRPLPLADMVAPRQRSAGEISGRSWSQYCE